MKAPLRPLPASLKWLFRILGVILPVATLALAPRIILCVNALRRGWSGPEALPSQKIQALVMQLTTDGAIVLFVWAIAFWMIRRSFKGKNPSDPDATPILEAPKAVAASSAPNRGGKRWSFCNVFELEKDVRRLWQFSTRSFNLQREEQKLPNEPLPPKLVAKDWHTLFQPTLNVAWLPADRVFLRVLQLPPADTLEETASMVELQLEKVSPLPVAQIVWTFELAPKRAGQLQTAIVVIAARHLVEEFLGKLEKESYLADRLEVPFIDQLLATKVEGDGVWVYAGTGADENNCVVAWWYGGVLQNVSLLHLTPAEERGPFLREQIAQMAWAGELEGWITSPPRRFLVADPEAAIAWQPMLQEGLEQRVEVIPPLPPTELARLTARRVAHENAVATLVPAEFVARYRQQFVDRLWMRAAFASALIYLVGVFLYLAWVQVLDYRVGKVEQQARNLSLSYTNAMRLKDQVRVMQDQLNLQFAALECYKAVAEKMPDGLSLEAMYFQRGKTLALNGKAPMDAMLKVNEFSDSLRHIMSGGQPLFKNVTTPSTTIRGSEVNWNFTAELTKGESD